MTRRVKTSKLDIIGKGLNVALVKFDPQRDPQINDPPSRLLKKVETIRLAG